MGGGGGVTTLLEILLNVLAPDAHDDTVMTKDNNDNKERFT